jgi:DNA-directed RNA polymerase subunit alpha
MEYSWRFTTAGPDNAMRREGPEDGPGTPVLAAWSTPLMTTDVRALLDRNPFDASAVADLREVLGRDPSRYATLRDAVSALRDKSKGAVTPDIHLRLGVGDVLLGRYTSGLEHLGKLHEIGLAQFFRGLALEYLQKWEEAAKAFQAA